jgi:hypothetical protein
MSMFWVWAECGSHVKFKIKNPILETTPLASSQRHFCLHTADPSKVHVCIMLVLFLWRENINA